MKQILSFITFFVLLQSLTACQTVGKRELAAEPNDNTKVQCKSQTRQKIRKDLFQIPDNGAIKVAFFDADSTVRISPSGSVSANSPTDVRILPNVGKVLSMLQKKGYLIYIVSNQNGVGSGIIPCETADGALQFTVSEIFKAGGMVHGYNFSENADEFRKPGIGMARDLEANLKELYNNQVYIDKKQSFMVGDSAFKRKVDDLKKPAINYPGDWKLDPSQLVMVPGTHFSNADRIFAHNFGIHFYEATDFFGWRKYGVDVLGTVADIESLLQKCTDCEP